ncbi:MAG: MoaD/ThiS family protein [Proteobacteria bacterium]|nr:MoaD/ThiS family protein [Pseudomonadota bacterium]
MLEIKIRLFVAFRDLNRESSLMLVCEPGLTVAQLRAEVLKKIDSLQQDSQLAALLQQSVFADNRSILAEDLRLEHSQDLAVIPPVCGG